MSAELSAVVGFIMGALGALAAVPVVIRVAQRTGFYDIPRQRGVPLVTGGRDHLTHRIHRVAGSPRRVAVTLAAAQLILCGLAIGGYELGAQAVPLLALVAFVCGVAAIVVLDTPRWRPSGIAVGTEKPEPAALGQARRGVASTQGERP